MPYVRIKTGPDKGKIYEIKDQVVTIGRDKSMMIQILDQGSSRNHAEIFKLGELYIIRDVSSTNGTYVNNVRTQEEVLKDGDEVLIGSTVLVFEDKPRTDEEKKADVTFDDREDLATTTVEISVDKDKNKNEVVVGREVESRNLQVTYEVSKIIAGETNFEAVMTRTLDTVLKAIGASHAYFLTIDKDKGKMTPRFRAIREGESAEVKLSRAIVKHVLKSLRPALTSDAMIDDRFSFSESIILRKIRSVICMPLLAPGDVMGVLYFHKSEGATFTVEDLELTSQVALQMSMAYEAFRFKGQLRRSMASAVRALVQAMEIHDPASRGHANRVADYAQAIAMQVGLPKDDVYLVRLSALLHDVGKLSVLHQETSAFKKDLDPRQLRDEKHVYAGEKIVASIDGGRQLLPGVKYHHERADGSGFPYKVKNIDTPIQARIVIVANAFENAISGETSGSACAQMKDVIKDFANRGGNEFDEDVIKALLICHRNNTLYQVPELYLEE